MKRKRFFIVLLSAVLFVVVFLVVTLQPKRKALYKVTILPSLGGKFTLPCAINDRGQVVGFSEVAKGTFHLFLWDRQNGMQDLGPVVNDLVQINDAGQVVATMRDPNDNNRAFIWDPNDGRRILPTLGGDHAKPWAINNIGQVVGHAETAAGDRHAFVWDANNGMRDLTPSSTKATRAFSINDAGQVVVFTGGGPWLISTRESKAFTSQRPPLRSAYHINNAGAVVGLSRRVKGKVDVVVWRPDSGVKKVAQLSGTFPGAPLINDAGQVFFWQARRPRFTLFGRKFFSTPVKNYLWDARQGQVALDGYVSVGRGENLVICDLNNDGCLIGAVQGGRDSRSRGVLFEPIPERWEK